jgi:ATP-binding cassette subfamily A (ABC1) protein 3
VNYTIFADASLSSIDVEHHTSDFERRVFALQWAVDQVRFPLPALHRTPAE